MTKEPCWYCGSHPGDNINGIDRLNSNQDYTIDNIKSCCHHCNMMKNTLDVASFLQHCRIISNANFEPTTKLDLITVIYNSTTGFSQYKSRATTKNLIFEITKQEYDLLTNNVICEYCDTFIQHAGIDRIDNSKGYTLENITSCCKYCNYMKKDYSVEDFINQCKKISDNIQEHHFEYCNGISEPNGLKTSRKRINKNIIYEFESCERCNMFSNAYCCQEHSDQSFMKRRKG